MLRKSRNYAPLMRGPILDLGIEHQMPQTSLKGKFETAKNNAYDYLIHTEQFERCSRSLFERSARQDKFKNLFPVEIDKPLPSELKRVLEDASDVRIYGIYDLSKDFETACEEKFHVPLSLAQTLRMQILDIETYFHRHERAMTPLLERLFTRSDPAPKLEDITLHFEEAPN